MLASFEYLGQMVIMVLSEARSTSFVKLRGVDPTVLWGGPGRVNIVLL